MATSTIAVLLQALVALLSGLQNNPQAPQTAVAQGVAITGQAIQLAVQAQALPKINFAIPKNDSIWPNITDLYNAAYLDANGNYEPQGIGVGLVGEDTSFGDLNGDGYDDAAVIVKRTDDSGNTVSALAAMLNQGGIMFNIADVPLGNNIQLFSHHIVQGGTIVLDAQVDALPRATYAYRLAGEQLLKQ